MAETSVSGIKSAKSLLCIAIAVLPPLSKYCCLFAELDYLDILSSWAHFPIVLSTLATEHKLIIYFAWKIFIY